MSTTQTAAFATHVEQFNPFPGLRTFEPDEDYLFFGREQQIDELLRRLRTTRFLAIIGTSGSGKSSLVRAGLIPSLHGGAMTGAGSSWRVAILRPGEDPLGNLAAALGAPEALGVAEDEEGLGQSFFETTLRASKLGLIECIRQARIPARDNVLVVVDQFEELFRFKRSRHETGRDEAVAFVKLLLEAARHREIPCYVALTMRSDFIGNCMEFNELPETVNEGLYLVPRMTRDELRSAIAGPVAVGNGTIAPRLVSRLLNDVGDDPDQLPILQHALLRTWRSWEKDHEPGEPLDLRHYEAIGTMKEALSRHAEEAYGELDDAGRRIAELLFKALTDLGTENRGIRRPATVGEVCALTGASQRRVVNVIKNFRRPGRSFLMPPSGVPLEAPTVLDLSHESLMRIWGRLAGWVDEEAKSARLYLGVARAAARHEGGASALWRDPELQLALTWREKEKPTPEWARRYEPSFDRAMAFLDASRAERDREIVEREQHRRRELRRARWLALALGAAALITFAFGGLAVRQEIKTERALAETSRQAEIARTESAAAEQQEREALRQQGLAEQQSQLALAARENAETQKGRAEAQRRIAEIERRNAESSALEAQAKKAEAEAARLDAEGQRAKAVEQRELAEQLRTKAQTSEQQAKRLSGISLSRALALQVPRMQQENRELAGLLALQAFRLNRDNQGEPEDPDLFNALRAALDRLHPNPPLRGHQDAVRALALAPDGRTLVSGGEDGKLLRFDLQQPASPPAVLGSLPSGVRSVALADGGNLMAAGSASGQLGIWNLRTPAAAPRELPAGAGPIGAVAIQAGGSLLAAGSADGNVRVWDLARPESPAVAFDGGGKRVAAVAFSPDGGTLAAGLAQGGGARLWDVRQPSAAHRAACGDQDVRSVAFSPDGKLLACGTGRGPILLADAEKPDAPPERLLGHASSVNSLSFSPSGDFLASASSDGKVRLWNLRNKNLQPIVFDGHERWVWSVAFTPNGAELVSGSEDRTARIWEARTERMAAELCQQLHRGLTREEWQHYMPADLPYQGNPPCPVTR